MLNGTFTFNGHNSGEYGIKVESFPVIQRSARKYNAYDINGRNGQIYDVQNAWEEAIVTYNIYAGGPQIGSARDSYYRIMEWLHSADDYAELTDTYDPAHYRKAIFLDSVDVGSTWYKHGRAAVTFRCLPQRFLNIKNLTPTVTTGGGSSSGTIKNPTSNIAKPLIHLSGLSAMPSLLKTTGRTEKTLSGNIRYFPDISSECVYKGVYYTGASGDSTKITSYSASTAGSVTVQASDTSYGIGMNVPVEGDTTYTLSGTNARFYILETDRDGMLLKHHVGQTANYTWHTRPDTRYIVIVFAASTAGTALTQSSLMLCTGATAQTYVAYTTGISTLRIGNIMASIGFPFTELWIDCENETVYGDIGSYSRYTTLSDLNWGNPTSEFLRLLPGDNAFAYTGIVSGISLDPRFWEV